MEKKNQTKIKAKTKPKAKAKPKKKDYFSPSDHAFWSDVYLTISRKQYY
jgi:hypothetical protein